MNESNADTGLLAGKAALITGATGGIGQALVRRLASDGASVVASDREQSSVLDELAAGHHAVPAVADLRKAVEIQRMADTVQREVGDLGVLVANAAYMCMGAFENQSEDEWWRQVETNLSGTFHLIRSLLPGMRRLRGGRIVVICSEWGVIGWPNATAYAASKAGLISMTKSLSRELAPEGIYVNAVAPGVIDTPQLEMDAQDAGVSREEISTRYASETPMRRIGLPEDIADAAAFLASERSSGLVGQVLQPNGGTTRAWA